MITARATYYLIYAALVLVTFFGDKLLKDDKRNIRVLGTVICLIADFAILGFGLYLYLAKGLDQAGFILGSILFIVCILCLLGRHWQNKELDKRRRTNDQ